MKPALAPLAILEEAIRATLGLVPELVEGPAARDAEAGFRWKNQTSVPKG